MTNVSTMRGPRGLQRCDPARRVSVRSVISKLVRIVNASTSPSQLKSAVI